MYSILIADTQTLRITILTENYVRLYISNWKTFIM